MKDSALGTARRVWRRPEKSSRSDQAAIVSAAKSEICTHEPKGIQASPTEIARTNPNRPGHAPNLHARTHRMVICPERLSGYHKDSEQVGA
jgi:hypothetical protein